MDRIVGWDAVDFVRARHETNSKVAKRTVEEKTVVPLLDLGVWG
jgi:hypothetical protein